MPLFIFVFIVVTINSTDCTENLHVCISTVGAIFGADLFGCHCIYTDVSMYVHMYIRFERSNTIKNAFTASAFPFLRLATLDWMRKKENCTSYRSHYANEVSCCCCWSSDGQETHIPWWNQNKMRPMFKIVIPKQSNLNLERLILLKLDSVSFKLWFCLIKSDSSVNSNGYFC